jgi:acetolactate synthase I/III small subunit
MTTHIPNTHTPSMHTLSVLVENKPGVLSHVAGLFSRRAFNIASLAVGPTTDEKVSRITIVVDSDSTPVEQVMNQLDKLVRVLKVVEMHRGSAVERELALIKVHAGQAHRGQLMEVAQVFGASVVDMSPTTVVLEAVSSPGKLDALLAMLDSYGISEIVRTGRIALTRGAGVITDEADPEPPGDEQPAAYGADQISADQISVDLVADQPVPAGTSA